MYELHFTSEIVPGNVNWGNSTIFEPGANSEVKNTSYEKKELLSIYSWHRMILFYYVANFRNIFMHKGIVQYCLLIFVSLFTFTTLLSILIIGRYIWLVQMEMKTFVSTNNEDISESLVNISAISIHQISSKDINTKCHQYMNKKSVVLF